MPARLPALLLLTLVSTARRAAAWPDLNASSVPFAVEPVDFNSSSMCQVPAAAAAALSDAGFVNVACPFGVLIAGTAAYRPDYLKYGAAVIANILDQDADGVADDPAVVAKLTYLNGNRGALLACGASRAEEERGDRLGGGGAPFGYSFSCQTHHVSGESDAPALDTLKAIMQEEAFHMVHQLGFARAHPDALGLDDFTTSVAARETARLQCVRPGWHHSENACPAPYPRQPGNPAPSPLSPGDGDCTFASCDVAEFYKQALFLAVGASHHDDPSMPEMWFSDLMPKNQSAAMDMFSAEFKAMIADPTLHQLTRPISGAYDPSTSPCGVPGGTDCTSAAAAAPSSLEHGDSDESAARSPRHNASPALLTVVVFAGALVLPLLHVVA